MAPAGALADVDGKAPPLTDDQQIAFDAIAAAVHARRDERFLLHGVTGSGKTEVYLRAIAETLRSGTPGARAGARDHAHAPDRGATARRASATRVAVLHSGLRPGERLEQWRRLLGGTTRDRRRRALGALRAARRPRPDRDRRGARRRVQERGGLPLPRARSRRAARGAGAAARSCSAPRRPRSRSRFAAERGELRRLSLPHRIGGRPLPAVELVDLAKERALQPRGRKLILSRPLRRGDRRDARRRRPGDPVPEPARLLDPHLLLRVRPRRALQALRHLAGLPRARAEAALPLLRLRDRPAGALLALRRARHRAARRRHRAARGGGAARASRRRASRASTATPRASAARPSACSARSRARRDRRPGRHADDRQGARLPGRAPGRRRRGGPRPALPRLPRGRAHLPAAHAGGGPRRPRRRAGPRGGADLRARPLRDPPGARARLRDLLPRGDRAPRARSAIRPSASSCTCRCRAGGGARPRRPPSASPTLARAAGDAADAEPTRAFEVLGPAPGADRAAARPLPLPAAAQGRRREARDARRSRALAAVAHRRGELGERARPGRCRTRSTCYETRRTVR